MKHFEAENLTYASLTDFGALIEASKENGAIDENSISSLLEWHGKLKEGRL